MAMAALLHLCPAQNATLLSFVPTRRKVNSNNLVKRLDKMIPTTFSSSLSSSEEKVYEVVLKQAALVREEERRNEKETVVNGDLLTRAYERCGEVCAEYAKTFYLAVQGYDEGMRLDLKKTRHENFDELYFYCYYVAGTVGLMSVPVMGIAPESKASTVSVYNAALALGIANQLTNILRDVGEDARRGRVYLRQVELASWGLSDEDIFRGQVTDKWRRFMKEQIKRTRMFFDEAEKGVTELNAASRWPLWASLLLYRQILDAIEANDYNFFTKRAYVGKAKKIVSLPLAYVRALAGSSKLSELVQS